MKRPAWQNLLMLAPVAAFPFLVVAALFLFKSSSLKRSIADTAIYTAQSAPAVIARIGLPIQPGWPIRGKVIAKQGNGNADLQIPLNGSHGSGLLLEWAQQQHGKWHICSLVFRSGNDQSLTLIDASTTHCDAE